jgi:uncharacterized SAM-binding protein YcdF (DUF218 family)
MNANEATHAANALPALAPAGERFSKRRMMRLLRAFCFFVMAGVLLFAGGFGWFANHVSKLTTPDNPQSSDAIIVLTGGQSRLDAGLELLKSGKGKRLLISGVHPSAGRSSIRAAVGGEKSLFSCCVDIDHAALDTIGNAEESAKWVTDHAYDSVLIVTNNYHMPRSLLEMGRFVGNAELRPYPVVNTKLDNGSWMTKPAAIRVLFTEYTKFLGALVRGFIPVRGTPEGLIASGSPTSG